MPPQKIAHLSLDWGQRTPIVTSLCGLRSPKKKAGVDPAGFFPKFGTRLCRNCAHSAHRTYPTVKTFHRVMLFRGRKKVKR